MASMDSPHSHGDIAALIQGVESGDADAAALLWNYCFARLQSYCRKKLPDRLRRILDEEDVALSAFKSFCLGAQDGKFGEIAGRDEFWKLLYCIGARKAGAQVRHHHALKRGGGNVVGESAFVSKEEYKRGIEQVSDVQPTAITLDDFLRDCEGLFEQLDTDEMRTIAMLRIEGYSVDEIANRMGCAKRSVERRLNLIRQIWKTAFDEIA